MANKLTLIQVRKRLNELGYRLLSKSYDNVHQKLNVTCKFGHKRRMTINRLYKKQHCAKCVSGGKFSFENVKVFFEKEKYIMVSLCYQGAREKLAVICPNGHPCNISLNKFKNKGQRCPECSFSGGTSKLEKELFNEIRKIYRSAKKIKHRRITVTGKPHVKGFDIDVFVPTLNKGIEFDGTYFHSYVGLKRSYPAWPEEDVVNYHKIKDEYFLSQGVKILHIKEEEWTKNRDLCVKKCLDFLKSK